MFYRKVYWTQQQDRKPAGANYRSLWEANLDGSEHKELIDTIYPVSCAINYKTNIIYCCNSNQSQHSIISFDPATRALKTVLPKTPMLFGLKVFQNHLIYNRAQGNLFQRISLKEDSDKVPDTLFKLSSLDWVKDVTVYHPDAQTGKTLIIS